MVNQNGVIVPSVEDLNSAVNYLINGISNNPQLNARFRANPVGYFNAIGIPTDAVPELMRELGLHEEAAAASICWVWSCFWTSGCGYTCQNTSVTQAAIRITATSTPLAG